jgi:hypothetical protein
VDTPTMVTLLTLAFRLSATIFDMIYLKVCLLVIYSGVTRTHPVVLSA